MLSCEMCSVPHANERRKCNAAGNWRRQWTTTDLIRCHPPWLVCPSWYVLTTDFTPWHHRDRDWPSERETLIKTTLSYRYGLFCVQKTMSFEQFREEFILRKKRGFSAYLRPLTERGSDFCQQNNKASQINYSLSQQTSVLWHIGFKLGMNGKEAEGDLWQRRKVARSCCSEVPTTDRQQKTSYQCLRPCDLKTLPRYFRQIWLQDE